VADFSGDKMNTLICFGGADYDATIAEIVENGPQFGADRVLVYDDRWLTTTPFYEKHKALWSAGLPGASTRHRGFGWFCWKPYIILDALKHSAPDDVVLYIDADTYPIHDLSVIFDIARRDGIMLFASNGWTNDQWVKRDCLEAMWCMDEWGIDNPHTVARFCAFKKPRFEFIEGESRTMALLDAWQTYSTNRRCTTFDPSAGVEHPNFREHRCEQAILSVLQVQYGIRLYREACQFGNGFDMDWDLYPQLFEQVGCAGHSPVLTGSRFRNIPWEGK
jgi:hypothetical protein